MSEVQVGAACVDVTPPLHIPYLGFSPRQARFEGVHDPLLARAAVFDDGETALAVVSVDALGLSRYLLGRDRDFIAEVRQRVTDRTGLLHESIMLAATHAHSTPETYGITHIWEREDCAEWLETFADRLAGVVAEAWADRVPATLRLGSATLPEMSVNRRARLGGPAPVDESVQVLLAEREGRGPVALANYACHPVTVQVNPLVSADFPGVAMALVEQAIGGHCQFLQGASGDINPVRGDTRDWRDVETYGWMLGGAVLEALGAARLAGPLRGPVLSYGTLSQPLAPREMPSEAEIEVNSEARQLAKFGPGLVRAEAQVFWIGPLCLVSVPGELFCELGLALQAGLRAKMTMVVECANGCVGYLVPEDEWDRGGYEVGVGAWCRVARGEPEKLVDAATMLARSMQPIG